MFKCRSSSSSDLMTSPRSKADKEKGMLSDTAKSVVRKQVLKDLYGYYPNTSSKYTEKGIILEDEAIDELSMQLFIDMSKNTERVTDKYFTGECDVLLDDSIRDIKCAWSLDTFPLTDKEAQAKVKKSGYDWQGQCYMHLYDRPVHYVDFILLPTPEHLLGFGDDPYMHIDAVETIPIHKRIRTVKIERNDDLISQAIKRVKQAQSYYLDLIKDMNN